MSKKEPASQALTIRSNGWPSEIEEIKIITDFNEGTHNVRESVNEDNIEDASQDGSER